MDITTRQSGVFWIMALAGRLDAGTAAVFDAEAGKLLEAGAQHIILDLDELEFISSAGLRSILTLAKSLRASGTLCFARMKPNVQEVFQFSGFLSIFKNHATLEEALGT